MRRALVLALPFAALAGCEAEPRAGTWTLRFATDALADRAELIEVGIERGGCGSEIAVYEDEIRAGHDPMRPPRLAPGTYGFRARARDASCVWFAFGCQERRLPSDDAAIVTILTAAPEEAACGAAECVDGRCGGEDAGMDAGRLDAGRRDAGMDDAGTEDTGPAPPPDTGPPDGGPPDTGPPDSGPATVPGLLARWECEDGLVDGQSDDATGRGHDATCVPGATCPTRVPGHSGMACSFSGDQHLVAANHPDFNTMRFTIALWFHARSLDGALFSKPVGTGASNSWQFEIQDPSATFTTGNITDSRQFLSSSTPSMTGRWYHLAGSYDGTNKRLYLDGVLVGTQAVTDIDWDSHDVIIGADANSGVIVLGFPGALDDIRVYNWALGESQIRSVMMGF